MRLVREVSILLIGSLVASSVYCPAAEYKFIEIKGYQVIESTYNDAGLMISSRSILEGDENEGYVCISRCQKGNLTSFVKYNEREGLNRLVIVKEGREKSIYESKTLIRSYSIDEDCRVVALLVWDAAKGYIIHVIDVDGKVVNSWNLSSSSEWTMSKQSWIHESGLVLTRRAENISQIISKDIDNGEEKVLGNGIYPAVSKDNERATVYYIEGMRVIKSYDTHSRSRQITKEYPEGVKLALLQVMPSKEEIVYQCNVTKEQKAFCIYNLVEKSEKKLSIGAIDYVPY